MENFSPTGWVAIYKETRTDAAGKVHASFYTRKVEAWDPQTGDALVVSGAAGRLVPARSGFTGFHRLDEAIAIVGVLPGAGWRLAHRDKTTGDAWSNPVVGFAVDSEGWAHTLVVEHPTGVQVAEDWDNADSELLGPGDQPSWERSSVTTEDRDATGTDEKPDDDQHDAPQDVAVDEPDDAHHDQDDRENPQ